MVASAPASARFVESYSTPTRDTLGAACGLVAVLARELALPVVVGGLLWLAILLLMTMTDFATRTWIGVPGR